MTSYVIMIIETVMLVGYIFYSLIFMNKRAQCYDNLFSEYKTNVEEYNRLAEKYNQSKEKKEVNQLIDKYNLLVKKYNNQLADYDKLKEILDSMKNNSNFIQYEVEDFEEKEG